MLDFANGDGSVALNPLDAFAANNSNPALVAASGFLISNLVEGTASLMTTGVVVERRKGLDVGPFVIEAPNAPKGDVLEPERAAKPEEAKDF